MKALRFAMTFSLSFGFAFPSLMVARAVSIVSSVVIHTRVVSAKPLPSRPGLKGFPHLCCNKKMFEARRTHGRHYLRQAYPGGGGGYLIGSGFSSVEASSVFSTSGSTVFVSVFESVSMVQGLGFFERFGFETLEKDEVSKT